MVAVRPSTVAGLCRRVAAIGALLLAIAAVLVPAAQAPKAQAQRQTARTDSYTILLLRTAYDDANGWVYSASQIAQATQEIHQYFEALSYGQLNLQVRWTTVTLQHSRSYYWGPCAADGADPRSPCPPPLFADAVQAAAGSSALTAGVNGLAVLSPWCDTARTYGTIAIERAGVHSTFQQSMLFECPFSDPRSAHTPGPSLVSWGSWAQEFVHQLENESPATDWSGTWAGHPSGYAGGYDLMDSCYPCGESAYGLLGAPAVAGRRTVFPGWLPSSKVVTIPPAGAPTGRTVVLAPLSDSPGTTATAQAIKVVIAPGVYYLVQVRRRAGADSYNVGPGIYDQGVQIQEIEEPRDPPARDINPCDYLDPGGCADPNNAADARNLRCSATYSASSNPDFCWPYPLWHAGQTYHDRLNNIDVRIDRQVGDDFSVTVNRGIGSGHPDMYITPWLTPPLNTWETTDIWVDSSCNGYEDVVGPSGLRYGRRADGTVIGSGDDPCANHENRIYAKVHNGGDAPANDVHVAFRVSDPQGAGVLDPNSFRLLGTVDSSRFPALAHLVPGADAVVYMAWTPLVNLTAAQIASDHFNFHSSVQVSIAPTAGEIVTSNNTAQETFVNFEARRDRVTGLYTVPPQSFFLRNPFGRKERLASLTESTARTFYLDVASQLPPSWQYAVAGGRSAQTLSPDEVRQIPVKILVPSGSPIGQSYLLSVDALTTIVERQIGGHRPDWRLPDDHASVPIIAGVTLAAQSVLQTDLSLSGALDGGTITAKGRLTPAPGAQTMVAIDYTGPDGHTMTQLAPVAADGSYADALAVRISGVWTLRSLWQGTRTLSSAVSPSVGVAVPKSAIGQPRSVPATATAAPTAPFQSTATATMTPVPAATASATPTQSATSTPTSTATPTATATQTATVPPTATVTQTATATATITSTPIPLSISNVISSTAVVGYGKYCPSAPSTLNVTAQVDGTLLQTVALQYRYLDRAGNPLPGSTIHVLPMVLLQGDSYQGTIQVGQEAPTALAGASGAVQFQVLATASTGVAITSKPQTALIRSCQG